MRLLLPLLAAAAVAAPVLATPTLGAQQRVDRRWPFDADGAVKVFNFVGSVRVIGWDRDTVAVTGTIPAGFTFFGGGSRAGVKFGIEGDQRGAADAAVLEVRVPAGANVWVRGAATDIEVSGLIGIVDVGTVGGRLVVTGSPRALTAESMSGAVEVRGSPETLRAKTAGGTLSWEGSARDAHLVSVSGDIRVQAGPLERVLVENVTGAVHVAAALRPDARVTVETHAGNVALLLPRAAPLRLDADAAHLTVPGRAPIERMLGKEAGPRQFRFHAGASAPAPLVTVRSFKGRLTLDFSP